MSFISNPQLDLAFEYVRNTGKNIFLTGKAGTGKTTFLHQIKQESSKRMVVAAPTGVAAINAGGMTLHSLFQLPFGLYIPGASQELQNQRRFSREKIQLLRTLDLLVIDEISMVRADLLDAVDDVLRRYRNDARPFGGVQLLMIGDLHQLPPVMEEAASTFKVQTPLDEVVRDDSFYGWIWDKVTAGSRIMLPRQYRMREPIGRVVSDLFYEGKLIHEAPHPRMPLPWPFDRELVWVDTGAQDEYRDAQRSVANEFEVALCKDITSIIRRRVRKAKLAVIAMYNSQVNRLQGALKGIVPPDDIESVDAFEGRESDGVILSLVRSNERAAIGFLNDPNRVNVAISRAKKLLVIVGDSKTVIGGAPELFGPLFEHCKEDGLVVGVGAVVTACQRVGIRSHVQRLSRPHRGERRMRRRRRGQRVPAEATANGETAISPNGAEPLATPIEAEANGAPEPAPVESPTEAE